MPRGEHNVLIEMVDSEGGILTAQTVTFKSPGKKTGRARLSTAKRPVQDEVGQGHGLHLVVS